MTLKTGPMTWRELSVWFGLKPDAISKGSASAKEKKLKKLNIFCDYHLEGKKLIIDKVRIPEYTKAYEVYEEKLDEEWGYIIDPDTHIMSWQYDARVDTCARVSNAIRYKYPEAKQVSEATGQRYTSAARKKKYGPVYKDIPGEMGFCHFVYLNEEGSGLLSDEQMEIIKECRKQAYQKIDEERFKIDEAYAEGEISKEEWQQAQGGVDSMSAYYETQKLIYEKLGFIPEKRTQLVDCLIME